VLFCSVFLLFDVFIFKSILVFVLGWKKFKCIECARGFIDKRDLIRHHDAVHLKIKKQVDHFIFKRKLNLTYFIDKVNLGSLNKRNLVTILNRNSE